MRFGLNGASRGKVWTSDVCVAGAGPAGLAAAFALVDAGLVVTLVESGGTRPDPQLTWRLADAEVVGDERFGKLHPRTNRSIGGTSWKWVVDVLGGGPGVRYAPIERGVLERRIDGEPSWPHSHDDMQPWYVEAMEFAGVHGAAAQLEQLPDRRVDGLETAWYTFGRADAFHAERLRAQLAAPNLTVITGATVTELIPTPSGDRIGKIRIRNLDSDEGFVQADRFVLASGTVENTRLLLQAKGRMLGLNDNSHIGQHLMDRPRVHGTLSLDDAPPSWFESFGMHRDDDNLIMERLITPRARSAEGTASTSMLLMPAYESSRRAAAWEGRMRSLTEMPFDWVPRIACRMPAPVGAAMQTVDRMTHGARSGITRRFVSTTHDTEWANWTRDARWADHRRWRVTAMTEQRPADENYIELTDRTDALGSPQVRLRWGRPASITTDIADSLQHASAAFDDAGIGRLSWPDELSAVSSCHMMGTVAIGASPSNSAADPDGLVWGTDNVYVAGNALIPQSGHANPTLTGIALALRTASRIAS